MRRRIALATLLASLMMLGSSALADSTNLLPNGDFEGTGSGSLTGWKGQSASLALVAGDGGGFAAQASRTGTAAIYGVITNPTPPVTDAVAGSVYTATGRALGLSGRSICLKIKEDGATSDTRSSCVDATGSWQTLPELAYTALADGDSLTFSVIQKNAVTGDTLTADNLTLTAATEIDPPSDLNATGVSAHEIDLTWDASTTPGITGYRVYRDGGPTPVATVNAPATSYPDTGLTAGTSHSYTVTAFDPTGESDASNQASAATTGGSVNLLPNGTFEGSGSGSLTGWKGQSASLALVAGDGGGFAARSSRTGSATIFGIITKPTPPVTDADAGTVYTANGRALGVSGKSICLKIAEEGAAPASATSCANGTGAWQTLPELDYTALADGDSLTFSVIQKSAVPGNTLTTDNLSLAVEAVAEIDPPSDLNATGVSDDEIDLTWDASTTPGITGYHVYRNGGSTPIATVDAPTTGYADTGLTAGTTYAYTVTAFDPTGESDASNQASAATTGGTGSVTIAAAGDIACNTANPNYNNGNGANGECMQKATADLVLAGSYAKVLALGDLQYDCGSLDAFNASYDASWGQFVGKTEPVLGNHDVQGVSDYGESCLPKGSGYYTYFTDHGVAEATGVNGKGYYSFDLGSWHLIALNANCTQAGGCGPGSPQMTWLESDLAAHPNACTLAYWHQASWSTTGDGGVPETRPLWATLANAGAELVLNGHFHHYERFADLDANGQPVADGTGMREIIAGIGGESQGTFGNTTPGAGSQVRKTGYGILSLTLGTGSYSWDYRQVTGGSGDSGSDTCH
jgi:acid phosphatase type 7